MSEDMTLLEKTEDEIREDVFTIAREETGVRNYKSTGVLRGLLETFSKIVSTIYQSFLSPIAKQTNLDTAGSIWLSQWGLMLGVVRKNATKTVGTINVTVYAAGTIPAGSWITIEGTELRYKVTQEVVFEPGVVAVPVEAELAGSTYNVADGTGIFTRVVAGVESVEFPEDWIETPGTDVESDADYRSRIKEKWQAQGEGNPPASYLYYALSVDGVQEAKLIRTPRGYGTVDVIIVANNGSPSAELLQLVEDALYDHELICTDVVVRGPAEIPITVSVEFSGTPTAAVVEDAVYDYIYSLGIAGKFEIRSLYAALDALGLDSVEILLPDRDVAGAEDSIIVADVNVSKV